MFQFPHTRIPIHLQSVPNVNERANERTGPTNRTGPNWSVDSKVWCVSFYRVRDSKFNHPVRGLEIHFKILVQSYMVRTVFWSVISGPVRELLNQIEKMSQKRSNWRNSYLQFLNLENLKKLFENFWGVYD